MLKETESHTHTIVNETDWSEIPQNGNEWTDKKKLKLFTPIARQIKDNSVKQIFLRIKKRQTRTPRTISELASSKFGNVHSGYVSSRIIKRDGNKKKGIVISPYVRWQMWTLLNNKKNKSEPEQQQQQRQSSNRKKNETYHT